MLYTGSRRRALVAPCFVLIALACGSCSSDTRAILAPSDSQLSLAAGGTAIANQPLAITVVVTKSDGSPVSDGTEVQLTASAGEFEASKLRTQGGQATTTYQTSGAGSVELVGTSDEVRGQLNLMVLSAQPSRITVSASAESVPDGGGELDVTATVLGPSGEPVAGAPVEFFATSGSFAPAGPFLTDANGNATTRLSTPSATEVRARVLTVESSTLSIAVQQKGGDLGLPFRMSDLVWLHAPDAADWDVTSEIFEVTFEGSGRNVNKICFPHSKAGRWKRSGAGEGNVWIIAEVDGTWYAATWDYIRPGQVCKSANGFTWGDLRHGVGAHTKMSPLNSWAPQSGQPVGFMVSGFARTSQRTVLEKSNIFMTEWP